MIPSLNSILSRLHARQLRLLVALADHGSLVHAAREVSISQPAASKALREIESIFGMELFLRTNRGLLANAAGRCVTRYAQLFQSDMERLRDDLREVAQGGGGRVAAGTIMGAVPLLCDAITEVLAQQPRLSVEILEDTSASLLSLLDQGRIEFALCRTSVSDSPQLYDSTEVQQESLALLASPTHRLAGLDTLKLADLRDARWVVYRTNMPIRRLLEREFHEDGLHMPAHVIETTSAFATMALLRGSQDMVALLPTSVADFCEAHHVTCRLALPVLSRCEPYELVTRRGAPLSPAAQLLVAELTFGEAAKRVAAATRGSRAPEAGISPRRNDSR
jgi:molybdate transport repressor ModE-like protein